MLKKCYANYANYLAQFSNTVMKHAVPIFLFSFLCACAGIEEEPEFETEITSYGIMEERDPGGVQESANPVPVELDLDVDLGDLEVPVGEYVSNETNLVVVRQTDRIPYELGTIFGFSWCSSGHPSGLTPLDILIEAPLVTEGIPGRQKFKQVWALGEVVDGTICRTESHLLTDDDEITPGLWVFSILMNRRIILTMEFDVGS